MHPSHMFSDCSGAIRCSGLQLVRGSRREGICREVHFPGLLAESDDTTWGASQFGRHVLELDEIGRFCRAFHPRTRREIYHDGCCKFIAYGLSSRIHPAISFMIFMNLQGLSGCCSWASPLIFMECCIKGCAPAPAQPPVLDFYFC